MPPTTIERDDEFSGGSQRHLYVIPTMAPDGDGLLVRKYLSHDDLVAGIKAPLVDFADCPVDFGDTSLQVIHAILAYAEKKPSVQGARTTAFHPFLEHDLHQHLTVLYRMLETDRQGVPLFLHGAARAIQLGLQNQRLEPVRLFDLCLSPTKERPQRYGLFAALFPFINELFNYQIPVNKIARLKSASLRTNFFQHAVSDTMEQFYTLHSRSDDSSPPITISDIVLRALEDSRDQWMRLSTENELTLVLIAREALTLRRLFDPDDPDLDITKHSTRLSVRLLNEFTLIGRSNRDTVDDETLNHFRYYTKLALQLEAEEHKEDIEVSLEKVQALLQSPEPLVYPSEYGLAVQWSLTRFVRRRIPNPHLDPENNVPQDQREKAWKRVFVVLPESIRKNSENFLAYQRDLVRTIALRLDIPLNPLIPVPQPEGLNTKQHASFLAQEARLKRLSDWHYLLLYPEVQRVFFEMLPYSGVPPIAAYKTDDGGLYTCFPWETPPVRPDSPWRLKGVLNHMPFLNYLDTVKGKGEKQKYRNRATIPARIIRYLTEAGGRCVIDHGTARMFFSQQTWYSINQEGFVAYTPQQQREAPPHDVDMLFLGKGEIGVITKHALAGIRDVSADYQHAKSMRGVVYVEVIKKMAKETIAHVLQAWMGREVGTPTSLLALGMLSIEQIRTFGLIPELWYIDNSWVALAKPVDIFGGLAEMTRTGHLTFLSPEDAFPPDQPIAISTLLRTFADEVWLNRDLDWTQFDMVTLAILYSWRRLKTSLNTIILKDLHEEAVKALVKTIEHDALRAWRLLADAAAPLSSYELADFYRTLAALKQNRQLWLQIQDKINTSPQLEWEQSEIERVARHIHAFEEARTLLSALHDGKEVTIDNVMKWLTETIFSEELERREEEEEEKKKKSRGVFSGKYSS